MKKLLSLFAISAVLTGCGEPAKKGAEGVKKAATEAGKKVGEAAKEGATKAVEAAKTGDTTKAAC